MRMEGVKPAENVNILARMACDDSALCALVGGDGVVYVAVNSRWGDAAVEHARRHAAEGVSGYMVCSVDACAVMRPKPPA